MIVAASLALTATAVWFGARAMREQGSDKPRVTASSGDPAHPEPTNGCRRLLRRRLFLSRLTPQRHQRCRPCLSPTGTAAPSESIGEAFEIVVASFRTASRATDVATRVAALGQPVRQRLAGGWQQVLAGPYGSAVQARDAQQVLERAGFTGTQVAPVAR